MAVFKHFWILSTAVFIGLGNVSRAELSTSAINLARDWAPLIWLHSSEQFFPSSVEFFLPSVDICDENGTVVQEQPTVDNILSGAESANLHMQTREPLECPSCVGLEVFYGQSVENGGVPVYTIIREFHDHWDTVDVAYHSFYPYNRGKDVCVGIPTDEDCVGGWASFGNHVGDWEHAEIRFQFGKPKQIYLSVHSFGAYYHWNEEGNYFEFLWGETRKNQETGGINSSEKLSPHYPPLVHLAYGTHPVAYSANGSHGLWSDAGRHTYLPFPLLEDYTEAGIEWRTWENLYLIEYQQEPYTGNLQWLNFQGDWGNSADGCQLEFVSGECQLGSGPSGPDGPDNLPPPRL